ncbi:hypothetical protein G5V59_16315 [Nocardioides sp. W3-2-3]|uniref:hypothetical protein n=1 Tax=Nocardioides convexus TaxID=2712224 RepID=UPI0024188A4A|nr:hypothetical protein [Nocardioides convexus]NHA00944.1 hypothetical protein [Nocardioides convexus]
MALRAVVLGARRARARRTAEPADHARRRCGLRRRRPDHPHRDPAARGVLGEPQRPLQPGGVVPRPAGPQLPHRLLGLRLDGPAPVVLAEHCVPAGLPGPDRVGGPASR